MCRKRTVATLWAMRPQVPNSWEVGGVDIGGQGVRCRRMESVGGTLQRRLRVGPLVILGGILETVFFLGK